VGGGVSVLDAVGLFLIIGLAVFWTGDHWSKQGQIDRLMETVSSAHALYGVEVGRSGEAAKRRDEYALQVEELKARLDEWLPEKPVAYSAEEIKNFEENRCVHCGGSHAIACPRIKSIRFRTNGEPLAVEFWADWPQDRVTYLEDILPPAEEPVSGG